jgi:hypothetical protein
MLTRRIGSASGLMKKVAQQWGCPIIGYRRRVVGQEMGNRRARIYLEGDQEGLSPLTTTNTPWGEITIPFARDMVLINP